MELNFNSVETIPVLNASAAFKTDSDRVFKEDVDIVPVIILVIIAKEPLGDAYFRRLRYSLGEQPKMRLM